MAKNKMRSPGKLAPKAAPVKSAVPAAPSQPVAPSGDAVDSNDPIIAKVQDAVRAKLPAQYRVAVQRIVLAGMKVMFSPETHQLMLKAIQGDTDPAHAVGMGVTQLMTLLYKESKGTMPLPALIPAGILLGCEALDFMEKSNMLRASPQIMDDMTQTVTAYLLQKMGYTAQDVARIAQGGSAQAQAPQPGQPAPQAAPAQPGASQGLIGQQMGAQ